MPLAVPKQLRKLTTAMVFLRQSMLAKAYPRTPFPKFEEFEKQVRRANERAVYASASELYFAAFFGRDTIEAAEDLMEKDPSFAREVIPLLASHQGTQFNLITEEEPGRIHHEYRLSPQVYQEITGEVLPPKVAEIYETLCKKWGGNEKEMTYYGSVDATPLYVKLVLDYIKKTNDNTFLQQTYLDKDNQTKTIRDSLLLALDWIVTRIEKGPREDALSLIKPEYPEPRIPLLEYKRSTEKGIPNQIWKDSQTAVLHENGKLPNHNYPIATVELQGHAYDALMGAAHFLRKDYEKEAATWTTLAEKIQNIVCGMFWLPQEHYFAQAIDRNRQGYYQIIKTATSDQTELLNTSIFDNLDKKAREEYITGIIQTVYNKNFLTDVGIRSRSLAFDNLVDYWDYHGSRSSWIKATYDFAKGLDRQGFYQLADQLKIRILNGVRIAGSFAELFYVAPNGRVIYDPLGRRTKKLHEEIPATSIPEHMQTWTASAVAAIEYEFSHPPKRPAPEKWKIILEKKLLEALPKAILITSARKAYKALPKDYGYKINIEKGHESEKKFRETHTGV